MEDLSQETKDEGGARTSPSGEADDPDDDRDDLQKRQRAGSGDEDDDEGTRQPYKCTFCRRGFPTAQALGGHMNVHRRHRGRSSAAAPTTGAAAAQGSSTCYEQPYYSATTPVVAFGQTHPASIPSVAAAGVPSLHAERQQPYELRLFGRDCAAAGRGNKEGGTGDVQRDRCCSVEDGDGGGDHGGREELDLELRLGGSAAGS